MQRAVEKKERGNAEYTAGNCEEAVQIYSDALEECLICEHDLRSVLLSNRAAALIKLVCICSLSPLPLIKCFTSFR